MYIELAARVQGHAKEKHKLRLKLFSFNIVMLYSMQWR